MSAPRGAWGSDTPVSRPEPADGEPTLVALGGFAMTSGGLSHGLTAADVEEIFTPIFAPEGYGG